MTLSKERTNTYRYGFCLSQTSGFTPNYGFVRFAFEDKDTLTAQHKTTDKEVLWYVDATAFTYEQAKAMADEKAQELFGKEPDWLNSVIDDAYNNQ